MLVHYPPVLEHALTWRDLYANGGFTQRELISSGTFNSRAKDRGIELRIGDESLIYLHEIGALRPVAFSRGPYWGGMVVPAESPEQMVFSDEDPSSDWREYEYELERSLTQATRVTAALRSAQALAPPQAPPSPQRCLSTPDEPGRV